MTVTPVLMACPRSVSEGFLVTDSVCTRTPGTSVMEFRGPGVCLPIWRAGMRARIGDGLGDVLILLK